MLDSANGNAIDPPRASLLVALLLFLGPLVCNLLLIGRWSLSGDEIYTLNDSKISAWEILTSNSKPVYYLICHYSMWLPFPLEFSMRLPAAIASALIPPTYYLLLWRPQECRIAVYAAILTITSPWLFELSQDARFYSLMFWFASLSALSLYRWLSAPRYQWLLLFLVAAALATLTHNSAVTMIPAGGLAVCVALAVRDWNEFVSHCRIWGPRILACAVLAGLLAIATNYQTFSTWLESKYGSFGEYSRLHLLAATGVRAGLGVCAMAVVPLLKPLGKWTDSEIFLTTMGVGTAIAFVFLVPFGGGVAPRYLLASLPCLIVLAAIHWVQIADRLADYPLRIALGTALVVGNLPALLSTLSDGGHYDYRSAVQFVESLELDNPIIASTSHQMYQHYASGDEQAIELGVLYSMNDGRTTAENYTWRTVSQLMNDADVSGRPLILVSRQDRRVLDANTAHWLNRSFTNLTSIERPRLDYQRNRLEIYQYRTDGSSQAQIEEAAARPVGNPAAETSKAQPSNSASTP
jgi:hypothetical protein